MKDTFNKYLEKVDVGKLLLSFMIMMMFLPRLVKKGMFGDGLLYASMSRNLAEGRGSFWKPFFSSSYWLEGMPATYYENPPLMLWVQSVFFLILGDHWWVEKLFCVCLLMINVYLFKKLWFAIFQQQAEYQKYWHLVPFWWYLLPVVIWGNVNNMMDNMLLTFCISSLYFMVMSLQDKSKIEFKYAILAGISIFLGLLTKGPVALYPIALPAIFWILKLSNFSKSFYLTFFSFLTAIGLMILLLYFNGEAHYFFSQYWEQRLKAVIVGSRDDMMLSGWERLYIIKQLIIELSPMVGIMILTYIVLKFKKITLKFDGHNQEKWAFVLAGLSATLPILASTKQSGIYLIPGLPMFAIAGAIISIPVAKHISNTRSWNFLKPFASYFAIAGIVVVLIVTIFNFGKPGREEDLIHDIELLKNQIPEGSKVGVCDEMMQEFVLHTYLQRMNKYELTYYNDYPDFLLSDHFCKGKEISEELKQIYTPLKANLVHFKVYKKVVK